MYHLVGVPPRGIRYAVVSRATPLNLQIVYVNVYGKVKCPTLGPASPVKSPWYPLVSPGRGIVGHPVDRCITRELKRFKEIP